MEKSRIEVYKFELSMEEIIVRPFELSDPVSEITNLLPGHISSSQISDLNTLQHIRMMQKPEEG